jgi:DNA polymerase I-like protein with 3'-5' exonuclease and polymerase domains
MKRALVIMDQCARQSKLEYRFVGNIHDEVQAEVLRAHAERFGRIASASIVAAGQYYILRCPLAGSHQIGPDWSQTH